MSKLMAEDGFLALYVLHARKYFCLCLVNADTQTLTND